MSCCSAASKQGSPAKGFGSKPAPTKPTKQAPAPALTDLDKAYLAIEPFVTSAVGPVKAELIPGVHRTRAPRSTTYIHVAVSVSPLKPSQTSMRVRWTRVQCIHVHGHTPILHPSHTRQSRRWDKPE
jgi:hypothetical protein